MMMPISPNRARPYLLGFILQMRYYIRVSVIDEVPMFISGAADLLQYTIEVIQGRQRVNSGPGVVQQFPTSLLFGVP